MPYELKRSNVISETLKVGDETLDIVIRPMDIVKEYQSAEADIIKAQDAVRAAEGKPSQDVLEFYGNAIVRLFGVLFGVENTEKILKFYEGNYDEMSLEVFPFITDVLKPSVDKEIARMRKRTRESYKKAKYGNKWNLGDKLKK